MLYFSRQCELKILWKSSERKQLSFGFPKGSPLLPFFQYAYKKLRQTGTLKRTQEKWHKNEKSTKCGLKPLKSISIKKIGLVIVLFSLGFFTALITFLNENLFNYHTGHSAKKNQFISQ